MIFVIFQRLCLVPHILEFSRIVMFDTYLGITFYYWVRTFKPGSRRNDDYIHAFGGVLNAMHQ